MVTIYKTSPGKITTTNKISEYCWIDINSPTEEDISKLKSVIDISEDILTSVRDIDEVPKLEKYDDCHFILIQTPLIMAEQTKGEDENYFVAPLGILYTSKLVVTLYEGKNDMVEYLKGKLDNYQKNKIIHTDQIAQLVLKLLLFTEKIYLRYLKTINQKIRNTQHHLELAPENYEIIKLMDLEKSLVYFSTSLHSNHVVFEKLAKKTFFTGTEDDRDLIEDILDESKQAIEMNKVYSKITSNVSNIFASIVSNNLNQTVKVLTSMTIILMIPTLVASVYGMNVALPFEESPHAFFVVIMISLFLSVLGALFFIYKKFF